MLRSLNAEGGGDLCCFTQHSRGGTVLRLRELNGSLYSPRIDILSCYHKLQMDLGVDSGMLLLLIGLCGCTGMDVVSILQKKRQPVTGLQVKATAERAEEHPRVYTQIHLEFVVTGEGVDPAAVERSIELSQTKYCSAWAMLGKSVEITASFRIEGA